MVKFAPPDKKGKYWFYRGHTGLDGSKRFYMPLSHSYEPLPKYVFSTRRQSSYAPNPRTLFLAVDESLTWWVKEGQSQPGLIWLEPDTSAQGYGHSDSDWIREKFIPPPFGPQLERRQPDNPINPYTPFSLKMATKDGAIRQGTFTRVPEEEGEIVPPWLDLRRWRRFWLTRPSLWKGSSVLDILAQWRAEDAETCVRSGCERKPASSISLMSVANAGGCGLKSMVCPIRLADVQGVSLPSTARNI